MRDSSACELPALSSLPVVKPQSWRPFMFIRMPLQLPLQGGRTTVSGYMQLRRYVALFNANVT